MDDAEAAAADRDRKVTDPSWPSRRGRRWIGWPGAIAGVATWLVANVVWFQVNRGAHLWDHEEHGYVDRVMRFGALRDPESIARALQNGPGGPVQEILGAPPQWIFGAHETTVIWQNMVLTAGVALALYWIGRQLATRGAGMAAGAVVLVAPGMLENSRGALTMVTATFFATLALVALVAGRGFDHRRWSIAFGVAAGVTTLSRPMAVAFIPGLVVAGILWSESSRTPRLATAKNVAFAGAGAVAASLWWWLFNATTVWDYLRVGAVGTPTDDPYHILLNRLWELSQYLDPVITDKGYRPGAHTGAALVVALVSYVGARWLGSRWVRRSDASATPSVERSLGPRGDLPLHPVWWAIVVAIATTLASNTTGWLMQPVVPWIVVAAMVGVRRTLPDRSWRWWVALVVGAAIVGATLSSTIWTRPGNRFTWCGGAAHIDAACDVRNAAQAEAWEAALEDIVDHTYEIDRALVDAGRTPTEGTETNVALAARGHILRPLAFSVKAFANHRWSLTPGEFFRGGVPIDAQLDRVQKEAGVVVVVPDPEVLALGFDQADPDVLPGTLIGHGFDVCQRVPLPDGRVVQILTRTPVPAGVCS